MDISWLPMNSENNCATPSCTTTRQSRGSCQQCQQIIHSWLPWLKQGRQIRSSWSTDFVSSNLAENYIRNDRSYRVWHCKYNTVRYWQFSGPYSVTINTAMPGLKEGCKPVLWGLGKPRLARVNSRQPLWKIHVGVLPWTCRSDGKWPSR